MKKQTILVQVRVGSKFENIYVKASNAAEAIEEAKKVATLKHHFASYVA